jgi:hypothetical protein
MVISFMQPQSSPASPARLVSSPSAFRYYLLPVFNRSLILLLELAACFFSLRSWGFPQQQSGTYIPFLRVYSCAFICSCIYGIFFFLTLRRNSYNS